MRLIAKLLRSRRVAWLLDGEVLLELFVASNLAVLAGDIVLAHSVNQFRRPEEYIPLYFSACAPVLLLLVDLARWRWGFHAAWRDLGLLVGWLSILVGLGGVLYHLQSSFFLQHTLQSLTYAAPFAAPLAYTGLGFLLLVNRMVAPRTPEWARWVVLLATGGFFGNFVLCLTDHATNGFFMKTEWIPVISSALATGFLIVPVFAQITRRYLDLCLAVLVIQALVGLIGFWFHLRMNLYTPGVSLFEKSVYGAPPMAPLLFPNLVALAIIGMWELALHLPDEAPAAPGVFSRMLIWAATVNPEGQAPTALQ
ncbi:MAG: hypothetical protein KGM96_02495 [Acidobacteriota bacterium]|nr:hypothetical protein [Acidobacteriota bacterium]